MSLLEAIVLGIIQGLTEFLPISSTAHLRVIPAFLGWNDPGAAFTAVIQIGTLVALLIYFRTDIYLLTLAWLRSLRTRSLKDPEAKLAWMIVLGTIPIVVLGLLFQKQIKTRLRALEVIAATAIVLALLLWLAEWVVARRQRTGKPLRDLPALGWLDALVVGMAQAVALIPGASRSGVTITGGLFVGMTRYAAARFSFLLALPSVFGAGVYELYKDRHELLQAGAVNVAVATVVAGIVGYATIEFLLNYLKSHSTYVFIGYRLALGILILVLLRTGTLHDQPDAEETVASATRAGYCLNQPSDRFLGEELP
jgi:undecaprenyl-diphosphatase